MQFHHRKFPGSIFTRFVHFGGGTENCRVVIAAVFPLEATGGRWKCSKNTSQTLGAVLPSRGV